MDIIIDTSKAFLSDNMRYRGFGLISANNSSRLLLDYKYEHPERYDEILHLLFSPDELAVSHLKIEMGSDINSSSGTEPCVKRTEDEPADVRRGMGFILASDAKKINPDITLDMLWWSEPRWVTDSKDVFAARYKWYRETLIAAYDTFGLKFDYVSSNRNERALEPDWAVYLSEHLKADKDAPYDFSAIKAVSGEEVGTWNISGMMLDKEGHPGLLEAVDVVGSHYTSFSDDATRKLQKEYGKEIWFSEGSSPMTYAKGVCRFDGSGLSGLNGALDVANRIITMFPGGGMTLYELQPAVAAYYDGAAYSQKQLILADEPWSGYYMLDSGFFTLLHFAKYIKKGWAFVDGACSGDGRPGGDGHSIVDASHSFMTCTDPSTGDYSTVITNATDAPAEYTFTVRGTPKASQTVHIIETKGTSSGSWKDGYLRDKGSVSPEKNGGDCTFSVTVQPGAIVTVTTLDVPISAYPEYESSILPLPFTELMSFTREETAERGQAPRYTTDQGGAFELVTLKHQNILIQKITEDLHADEWGATPEPVTCFGDDRWFNYKVTAEIILADTNKPKTNYAGVGLRYDLADNGASGYSFRLYENGSWELRHNSDVIKSGSVDIFAHSTNKITIEALNDTVSAYVNIRKVCSHTADGVLQPAGRAAVYSSYHNNTFTKVSAEPPDTAPGYVRRVDVTDEGITYSGDWSHNMMDSFRCYRRTSFAGSKGASFSVGLDGTGVMLLGANDGSAFIDVSVDGKPYLTGFTVPKTAHRQCFFSLFGLDGTGHSLTVSVSDGILNLDSVEIVG